MKVCILTSVHPPFDARIFHKQAKTLMKAGYDVTLIVQHDINEIVDGVKIIALSKSKNRLQRIFYKVFKVLIEAIKQKADVYHFHDPELLYVGALLKLLTGKKVIYDIHENVAKQILYKDYINKLFRPTVSFCYRIFEKPAISYIDYLVIADDSIKENYFFLSNVVLIRNYPIIKYLEINLKNQTDVNSFNTKFNISYVGGIEKIRGAIELCKAFNLIKNKRKDIVLNLIGPISQDFRDELTKTIDIFNLKDIVIIHGVINHIDVYRFIKDADVGVAILHPVPNLVDAMVTKLFEYMASGIPIVASNFPLWKKFIEDNNFGICVDPFDPKEIADAIEYLIEHQELAKKMGENGRRAVLEKYNWEIESMKLLQIYEEIKIGQK